jgi:choline-glycine betaine transporter
MRRLISVLVILFVVWLVVQQPASAADAVRTTADWVMTGFDSIYRFMAELF